MDGLSCWKCGADLCAKPTAVPQPLGRAAECPSCRAQLHVCRMCRHFDPGKAKQCRERAAEPVQDKTRANFCDWFQPRPQAHAEAGAEPVRARSELESLFGAEPPANNGDNPRKALDDLFGP